MIVTRWETMFQRFREIMKERGQDIAIDAPVLRALFEVIGEELESFQRNDAPWNETP